MYEKIMAEIKMEANRVYIAQKSNKTRIAIIME